MTSYCDWCGGDLDEEEAFGIYSACCSEECAIALEEDEEDEGDNS